MSFDKIFSMMYRLNENKFGPDRGKVVAGDSKLVAVPIDRDSLKVKLVGDMQDYIVSGRLTKPGFDGIINWLNQQPDIADYYYKLKDLKTYFIVYEILQDREDALIGKDKQVFKFTIAERKAVPALNPAVSHVTQEEVELIRSGGGPADLVIPVGTKALDGGTSGTSGVAGNTAGSLSVEQIKAKGGPSAVTAAGIKDNVDPKVISLLTTAYNLIKGDATAGTHPGMPKVRAELAADKLGSASQAFVRALNAGFGILDAKFNETPDTGLNTSLISKILTTPIPVKVKESRGYFLHPNGYSLIKEEASAIIGFDADSFVAQFSAELEAMKTKTGDIVVPPEGFKFQNPVTTKSPELAKFQTLLKTNLPTWKGGGALKVQVVKDFMKATADGGYGTRTQALVFWLKDGLSAPKYADSDKNTILPDFVNRMLKEFNLIKESNSYRGIRSRGVISEEFDFDAAADSGGTVVTPKVRTPKVDKDGNPIVYVKKEKAPEKSKLFDGSEVSRNLSFAPTYEFKNSTTGIWYAKLKTDGPTTWTLCSNYSVNLLQTQYKADGGYWTLQDVLPPIGYDIKDGRWVLSKEPTIYADDATIMKLNAAYPKAGQTQIQVSAGLTVAQIDALHIEVANQVKTWITTPVNLKPYKGWGWGNDDEVNAWEAFRTAMSSGSGDLTVNGKLTKTAKAIALTTSNEKKRLEGNQANLVNMWNGKNNTMKNKFLGDTSDDTYTIRLGKADGSIWELPINTDF